MLQVMNKKNKSKTFLQKNTNLYLIFLILLSSLGTNLYASSGKNADVIALIQTKTITLNFKNSPIQDILKEIKNQSGVGFMIKDNGDDNSLKKMSLNVKNVTIEAALTELLKGVNYTYTIVGKIITIEKKEVNSIAKIANTEKKSLQTQEKAEERRIKGKVLDSEGRPIVGATIIIGNTSDGVISDADGNFI